MIKKSMKKALYNIGLGGIAFGLTIVTQYLYHLNASQLAPAIELKKYIILGIFFLIFSFSKSSKLRLVSLSFVLFFSFFQWSHISYYGTRVFPHEIWLMFTQMGEIVGTLKEELHHLVIPFLLCAPSIGFIYWLNRKWDTKLVKIPFVSFLFIFYFTYNPIRTYVSGNTWGRQPSIQEFDGVNTYLSLSYFLGRILPGKISGGSGADSLEVVGVKGKPKDINILMILGESLTPNHMSLYGYKRETTPYLETLATDPNFIFTRALSSGVSSDIAVAMFFNNTYGLGGTKYIFSGENCLFNLARQQGYSTKFYSTQSSQQLRYINSSICPKYVQDMKSLEDIDPEIEDSNAADDMFLVKELKEMDMGSKKKQFVTLHMRGTHGPFNLRYPAEFGKFVPKDAPTTERVGHYDNGVAYFDHFMKNLIAEVKTFETPTLVVYVSDHGEGLGEQGVWGHGSLNEISATTPYLLYKHKMDNVEFELPKLPTHLNVSLLMSELLGFKFNFKSNEQFKDYEILGNDIDGYAGRMLLQIKDGEIINQQIID